MSRRGRIGSRIREIRISKNMSQKRFGEKIGLSGKSISAYETGRATPSLRVLEDISTEYSADFVQLVGTRKDVLIKRLDQIKSALTEIENAIKESMSF